MLLQKHFADTHRDAAADLSVDDVRADQVTAVLDRKVSHDLGNQVDRVDLDCGQVGTDRVDLRRVVDVSDVGAGLADRASASRRAATHQAATPTAPREMNVRCRRGSEECLPR